MPDVNPTEKLSAEGVYKRIEEMVGLKIKEVQEQHKSQLDEARAEAARERSLVDKLLSGGVGPNERAHIREKGRLARTDKRGLQAAKFVRYMLAAKGHPSLAADLARRNKEADVIVKALGEASVSAGGAAVPADFAAEIVDALRDVSTIMQFDPIVLPMPKGNISMPFVGTGITASYTGENTAVNATEPTLGQLSLSARKLMALVPSSNDLLKDGGPEVERMIRDDLVGAFVEKMDSTFLRGTGLQDTPKGLLYWCGSAASTGNRFNSANVAAAADGSTLAEITNDLGKSIQKVLDGKLKLLDPMRAGWVFSNRIWKKLATVRDGNSNLVFKPEMDGGTLFGFKWARTSQIPNNLGGGTDSSEVYFASFGEGVIVAETSDIEVGAYDGAAYVDSGGTVRSGLSLDQTVFKGTLRHDFGCRYRGAEVAVIEAVRWGA